VDVVFFTIYTPLIAAVATIITSTNLGDKDMMHQNFHGGWLCGPEGFFSGSHLGGPLHLLVWGLLLYLIYKAITHIMSGRREEVASSGYNSSAMTILHERYASGEIDKEEFLQKKKDLNG